MRRSGNGGGAADHLRALNQRSRKLLASPAAGTPAVTLYRYDTQGHLVEEIAGSAASAAGISVIAGQSLVTYVWKDDIPSAVTYAPNSPGNPGNASERIVYLHTDHLDTPRKATDATGRIVWTWESDAFGSSAALDDPDNDGIKTVVNLRLPGQYFDAESGLHYNWHRYYDPLVGRYTQSDPIGLDGGINTYAYGLNNPLLYSDPTGENPGVAIAAALAAAREAIKRCAGSAICKCRAIHASYKAMCGIGCRGTSCEVVSVQVRAAQLCFQLRTMYVSAGCDRVIPTSRDHPGAAQQAKKFWENCETKRRQVCGCDDGCSK